MKPRTLLVLVVSHVAVLAIGFAGGIYLLPILVAPPAPDAGAVKSAAVGAQYTGEFRRDLKGSDFLHWGEGKVAISRERVAFSGRLAPGPDYKLYFTQEYVDTKEGFLRLKERAFRAGDVKTFENFIVPLPAALDPTAYTSVVVWCERFSMFITAAKYK